MTTCVQSLADNSRNVALILPLTLILVGSVHVAGADTVFFDNFSDRDAEDGMPVTWTPVSGLDDGTFDASSGDYVITTSPSGGGQVTRVPSHILGDTSIRARVRTDPDVVASLMARAASTSSFYAAGIRPRTDAAFIRRGIDLALAITDLDPGQEDIMLQFDLFGDQLKLFAWRPDEPKPSDPLVMVSDSIVDAGPVGLIVGTPAASARSATYRFVQVANMPIPEPATACLASLCVACLIAGRWGRRRGS